MAQAQAIGNVWLANKYLHGTGVHLGAMLHPVWAAKGQQRDKVARSGAITGVLPLALRRESAQLRHAMENKAIFEAIALRRCLAARYNKLALVLAPHVLYRRNDSFFIDAITITRDGERPREDKVGSYNLAGLSEVEVVDQTFDIHPLFDRMDVKYRDHTLFMIDAD